MTKKNILLIPTTDNIVTNWSEVYQYLHEKGYNIYIIVDNKLINKEVPKEFIKIDSYIIRLQQFGNMNFFKNLIIKYYTNIYIEHILKMYNIDIVIVSNDNPIIQNICVNKAKKIKIKTILHQAAGVFKKPIKLSIIQQIRRKINIFFFNHSSCLNIGNDVDLCLIQGKKWIEYIDNTNYEIIGNEYYRNLRNKINSIEEYKINQFKNKLGLKNKKLIVFYSQPFKELKMTSHENIEKFYTEIKYLENKLLNSEKYLFVFKPHPQEFYYKNFNFINVLEKIDLNLLIASSYINLAVFSTMAIQSKVSGKKTLGFLPKYFSDDLLNQIKMSFDYSSNDIEDIYKKIDNNFYSTNNDFSNIIDLNIDTKKAVEMAIL